MSRTLLLGEHPHRLGRLMAAWRRVRRPLLFVAAALFVWHAVHQAQYEQAVHQARLDMSRISHAARLFRADFGRCPRDLDELVHPPDDGDPYVTRIRDPWGRPYRLECPSWRSEDDVEVISDGPDVTDSRDDQRNWVTRLEE